MLAVPYDFPDLFKRAILSGGGIYCPWGFEGRRQKLRKLFTLHSEDDRTNKINADNVRHVLAKAFSEQAAEKLLEISDNVDHAKLMKVGTLYYTLFRF